MVSFNFTRHTYSCSFLVDSLISTEMVTFMLMLMSVLSLKFINFYLFSLYYCTDRVSGIILSRGSGSRHSCLFFSSYFKRENSGLLIKYCLFLDAFIRLRKFTLVLVCWEFFINYVKFSQTFFCIHWEDHLFFYFILFFYFLIWCMTLIDFQMLSYCVLG